MNIDSALDFVSGLRLPDGRLWGTAAVVEQRDRARRWLGEDVRYHFDTAARGWDKTGTLAACSMALMATDLPDLSRCFWLAADRDQGRIAVESIAGFVRRSGLAGVFVVDAYRVTFAPSGSTLEVLAADAASSWGITPALVAVDEIAWWADTASARALFDSVSSSAAKLPKSRLVIITTPSSPTHWSYKLLEHARRDEMWSCHEQLGPAPWIDEEKLAEAKRRLATEQNERLFEGRWAEPEDVLATREDVLACVAFSGALEPQPHRQYTIGLDVGLKHDRTVASVAHVDDDGLVWLDRVGVWAGTRKQPVDLNEVEDWVHLSAGKYNNAPVIADPWQSAQLSQRLRRRGVHVEEFVFSQSSISKLAISLFNAIHQHRLRLPDDEALIDELARVRLKETAPGLLRLDHVPGQHDDRAVSLALAAHRLLSAEEVPLLLGHAFGAANGAFKRPSPWAFKSDWGHTGASTEKEVR